jgi:hypothetical protein
MPGVGNIIPASDYNNIQTKIEGVMGVGSGQSGYGQTLSSAQVSGGTTITASGWAALRSDLLKARQHQTGVSETTNLIDVTGSTTATFTGYISGTTLNVVSLTSGSIQKSMAIYGTSGQILPGTVIQSGSGSTWTLAVQGNPTSQTVGSVGSPITITAYLVVTDLFLTEYNNFADACVAGKLTVAANQLTTADAFSTNTRTTAWNGTLTNTVTITFPSAAAARYYFNAGGDFRITASRTGGTTSGGAAVKNATWDEMISTNLAPPGTYYPNAVGVVSMNYNSTSRTGSGTAYAIGFYSLTNSDQIILSKDAPSGSYSVNKYVIKARCNVANNASGGATQVIFTIEFQDNSPNPNTTTYGPYGPFGVDENPDGTLVSNVYMGRPSGANVAVTAPSVTQTGF